MLPPQAVVGGAGITPRTPANGCFVSQGNYLKLDKGRREGRGALAYWPAYENLGSMRAYMCVCVEGRGVASMHPGC